MIGLPASTARRAACARCVATAEGLDEEQDRAGLRIVDQPVGDLADARGRTRCRSRRSCEKPTPRPRPRDIRPPVMLPDCEMIASGPGTMSSFSTAALTESAHDGPADRCRCSSGRAAARRPPARWSASLPGCGAPRRRSRRSRRCRWSRPAPSCSRIARSRSGTALARHHDEGVVDLARNVERATG